ncbi:MAG TPA: sugar nucleotide-binding protein, partial [Gemmatimonadaceae bacterium]|nr:sugar nucleotide-binding protein [Gemmatimonadaceae bacterium]
RGNVEAVAALAGACGRRGIALATFSSDLVFDGAREVPYVEGDAPAPLAVYGRTKAEAERVALALAPRALVIRTSAFFGPWDAHNFVTRALDAIAAGRSWPAASDLTVSPTYVPDLADAALDLLIDGETGVWHLANDGAVTWAELARAAAERARLDASLVYPRTARQLGLAAARPRYSALGSERGTLMPSLDDAIARYLAHRPPPRDAPWETAPGEGTAGDALVMES